MKECIIVTSDEPWGPVLHTQLRFAEELANFMTVIYINPPKHWNLLSYCFGRSQYRLIKKNLYLVDYINVFPLRIFPGFFLRLNDFFNSLRIFVLLKKNAFAPNILWRFDHHRFIYFYFITFKRKIYHPVDEYYGHKYDANLATVSDLVIAISPKFVERYSKYNKNVINVPQGVSDEERIVDKDKLKFIRSQIGTNFIIFIGTVSEEIDLNLLYSIAGRFKSNKLLLIGPLKLTSNESLNLFSRLNKLSNFNYLGVVDGHQLKYYVFLAALGIIPYKFPNEKRVSIRSPLKVISYLSQLKPVVSSIDCEIDALKGKAIFEVTSGLEFTNMIELVLGGELMIDKKGIINYLDSQTYNKQIQRIIHFLKISKPNEL